MKVIYIYNPYNSREVGLLDQVKEELGNVVEEVEAVDFQEVKEQYRIAQTPAIIYIRDDWQGEQLLNVDDEQAKLRVTLDATQYIEEEEKNIHEMETYRLDFKVKKEITAAVQPVGAQLVQTKLLQKQAETTANAVGTQLVQTKILQKQTETTANSLGSQLIAAKLELAQYKNNETEVSA